MLSLVSKRISSMFVTSHIIKQDDFDVYAYSFEVLLSTLLNALALFSIGVLTHRFLETLVFVVVFVPLRSYAGGYHAKNHLRCFLVLLVSFFAYLLILEFMPLTWYQVIALTDCVIAVLVIYSLAPVEDANKPLDERETKKYGLISKIIVTVFAMLVVTGVCADIYVRTCVGISLGMLIVAVSVFGAHLKTIQPENNSQ